MEIYTIGNLTADIIILTVKDFPDWGTELFINELDLRCGGNLGNTIFQLKKIKVDPIVMGNLGNDYFARTYYEALKGKDPDQIENEESQVKKNKNMVYRFLKIYMIE